MFLLLFLAFDSCLSKKYCRDKLDVPVDMPMSLKLHVDVSEALSEHKLVQRSPGEFSDSSTIQIQEQLVLNQVKEILENRLPKHITDKVINITYWLDI